MAKAKEQRNTKEEAPRKKSEVVEEKEQAPRKVSSPEKPKQKNEPTPACKIPEVEVPNKSDANWELGEDQLTALLMSKKKEPAGKPAASKAVSE
jgi:hypothetical protein